MGQTWAGFILACAACRQCLAELDQLGPRMGCAKPNLAALGRIWRRPLSPTFAEIAGGWRRCEVVGVALAWICRHKSPTRRLCFPQCMLLYCLHSDHANICQYCRHSSSFQHPRFAPIGDWLACTQHLIDMCCYYTIACLKPKGSMIRRHPTDMCRHFSVGGIAHRATNVGI